MFYVFHYGYYYGLNILTGRHYMNMGQTLTKLCSCAAAVHCKDSCLPVEQKLDKRQNPSLLPSAFWAQSQG